MYLRCLDKLIPWALWETIKSLLKDAESEA